MKEQGRITLTTSEQRRLAHNAVDPERAHRVVELATTKYAGFNQQHLTEMLARRRRPPRHRRRRDRYPREGMLIQLDASRHDWLEGRGPILSLLGGIDDATGRVPWTGFREQEDAQGCFEVMRETVRRFGVPMAARADRHSIFVQTQDKQLTLDEQLSGRRQPAQFGRLLEELGVELIYARSPQAKGRIERLWGTFQDRLASELRLAQTSTPEEANRVLARFLPLIDIPPSRQRLSYARARVELHERFDGTLCVYLDGLCLAKQIHTQPKLIYRVGDHSDVGLNPPPVKPPASKPSTSSTLWRPAPNHPWRRLPAVSAR